MQGQALGYGTPTFCSIHELLEKYISECAYDNLYGNYIVK